MPTRKTLLATAAALLGAGSAHALTIDFKPLARVQVTRDDNLFRVPDSAPKGSGGKVADTISRYGGGATLKLSHSLQTVEVRGEYDRMDYASQNQLDHNRYRVGATAALAMGSTLKLRLDAGRERRLENFIYRDDTAKGFLTLDAGSAELGYAITPRYTLLAKGDYFSTRATLNTSRDFDVTERGAEAGLRYEVNGFSRLELAVRDVHGDFPERMNTPGDGREKRYEQQSVQLRMGYIPSGLTDLSAQVGYTRRIHDDPLVNDFNGVTGRLSVLRRVSGRTQLRLDGYRDLYYIQEAGANFVENLGVGLGADYLWSAKLRLGGTVERIESRYRGSDRFTLLSGDPRADQVLGLRLGAEYRPFYRFSITPEYRFERRSSNEELSGYRYNSFGIDFTYRYGTPVETQF